MNEDSGPTRLQITKTRAWGKTELGLPLSSEEMTQASACAPELSPVRGRLPWWGSGKMWGEGSQPAQKRSGFSEERWLPWFSSSHPSPAHCSAQQPTSPYSSGLPFPTSVPNVGWGQCLCPQAAPGKAPHSGAPTLGLSKALWNGGHPAGI